MLFTTSKSRSFFLCWALMIVCLNTSVLDWTGLFSGVSTVSSGSTDTSLSVVGFLVFLNF